MERKVFYPQFRLFFFAFYILLLSCKKEDHSNHDIHHQIVIPVPFTPYAVYVADEHDGAVSVIDPIENKKIGSIHVSDHANSSEMLMTHNVQVAPNGKSIWVTGTTTQTAVQDQIIVIDPLSNHSIIKRIYAGINQHLAHVVLDSASNFAFVTATESNEVIKIDAKTFTEIKRYNMGNSHGPHGLRYFRGKLYVANMYAKSLSIIDIATEQITELPLGGTAIQTAVSPDGKFVFISLYYLREIARYDLVNQQLDKITLPAGSLGPIQIYPTPDSKKLYVCDQGMMGGMPASNKIYVIDIYSGTITDTILAGQGPHGVVVSNDGKYAYVTNYSGNTVSVIDNASKNVICTIPAGKAPGGISYRSPEGGMP